MSDRLMISDEQGSGIKTEKNVHINYAIPKMLKNFATGIKSSPISTASLIEDWTDSHRKSLTVKKINHNNVNTLITLQCPINPGHLRYLLLVIYLINDLFVTETIMNQLFLVQRLSLGLLFIFTIAYQEK